MKNWISGAILMLCAGGALSCPVTELVENSHCLAEADARFTVSAPYVTTEAMQDYYAVFTHDEGSTWRVTALGPRSAIYLDEDDLIKYVPGSFTYWCKDTRTMLFQHIRMPDGSVIEAVTLRQRASNVLLWDLDPEAECDPDTWGR